MLSEFQKLHVRKVSIIEGSLSTIWSSFTGGSYLTGLFIWLGASTTLMGVYGAMTPLANVVQPLLLAILGKGFANKKKFVVISVALFKPWFFILVLTSLINGSFRIWVALVILFFFRIVASVAGPIWTSWMSDVTEHDIYGRYFGFRNFATQVVGALFTLAAGYLLDIFGKG